MRETPAIDRQTDPDFSSLRLRTAAAMTLIDAMGSLIPGQDYNVAMRAIQDESHIEFKKIMELIVAKLEEEGSHQAADFRQRLDKVLVASTSA